MMMMTVSGDNNESDDKEDEVRRVMMIFHDFMIESLYVCVFVKKMKKRLNSFLVGIFVHVGVKQYLIFSGKFFGGKV